MKANMMLNAYTDSLLLFLNRIQQFKHDIESKVEHYFNYFSVKWTGEFFVSDYLIQPLSVGVKRHFGITLELVSEEVILNEVDLYFKEILEQNSMVSMKCNDQELEEVIEKHFAMILEKETLDMKNAEEILHTFTTRKLKTLNGTDVNYYFGGNGNEVILIMNAFGQSIHYWCFLLYELIKDYKVIIWEPRGTYWKEGGCSQYTSFENHIDDIDMILSAEEIEQCYFLGWCTAPKVALQYYAKHEHRVKALMFISGSFKGVSQLEDFDTNYEKNLQEISKLLDKQPGSEAIFQRSILSSLNKKTMIERKIDAGDCDDIHDSQFTEVFTSARTEIKPLIGGPFQKKEEIIPYFRQLSEFWSKDVRELIQGAKIPMLFISGDFDQMASSKSSELLASISSQAVFIKVKRGNHFILIEQSELIYRIIHNFILDRLHEVKSNFVNIQDYREGIC
ncbi:pimeloyl-ACP methyl ester carboxylesterase [Paenibacillus intestini]|nr:pimeloyl-ACP methyl ester carboxylesterase [Paenibacillus intestini]